MASKPSSTPAAHMSRSAALLAAEARLKGLPNPGTEPPPVVEEKWEPPSEKEDRDTKIKLVRLLDRGIVRDNTYERCAQCVETLVKIATNILQNENEPKYRTIRATNSMLKNSVLACAGGHEFLIALGFRVQKENFEAHYVIQPTRRRMHELRIGTEALTEHLAVVQDRLNQQLASKQAAKNEADICKARALAEIDNDREEARARQVRERQLRELRTAAHAKVEADEAMREEEARAAEAREAVRRKRELAQSAKDSGEELEGSHAGVEGYRSAEEIERSGSNTGQVIPAPTSRDTITPDIPSNTNTSLNDIPGQFPVDEATGRNNRVRPRDDNHEYDTRGQRSRTDPMRPKPPHSTVMAVGPDMMDRLIQSGVQSSVRPQRRREWEEEEEGDIHYWPGEGQMLGD
ncbi:hypothetical protein M231_05243 [Tremella mesenterica]|uniref:PUB domain-containing protein n=1 Tax=Tremella mesenterica TaxID=5217 RepID=A0A4Q1BIV8_TREME|nr:hypothetical protein M231_05243 [Tremella mesenterica]